jgi:hypothetical protein
MLFHLLKRLIQRKKYKIAAAQKGYNNVDQQESTTQPRG